MKLPEKCVVDTNVPKTANLAINAEKDSDVRDVDILACVEAIDHVIKNRALVIDQGDEIFTEYRNQLSLKGQPGMGDRFMKWVKDNRWTLPESNRVPLTKTGDSYEQFPPDIRLKSFDPSDKKFIAVAYGHPDKPPILQAVDSKWWGYREMLLESGIEICFLCPDYVENKYNKKRGAPQ